ncbi:unnamed protein product [marine sediment metagenome]|uniref:Rrf2 family transcriptional regulator n=1 Tax=marine sediment metagenome TaxID=412755 RepID=X0XRY7_9ZZZZ
MIYLTQRDADWPIPGPEIAEQVGIPRKYLSKVLGDLVRCGMLDSAPGKRGGFRLRRPAREITLVEVLTPFEQFGQRSCPFGNQHCSDDHPCLAHNRWKAVLETQQRFLEETSIHDVAFAQD